MAAVAAVWMLLCADALADVFMSGQLQLVDGDAPAHYELTALLPRAAIADAAIQWPAGCTQTAFREQPSGRRVQLLYRAACDRAPDLDEVIRTSWRLDAARLTTNLQGASSSTTLQGSRGELLIPFGKVAGGDRHWLQIARAFTWQGMWHIWSGWDHLAFVLCLCMLAGGWRLLGLVTAFTLGHSISLALAFHDVVRIPIPPTEALIALSIVLIAREALLASDAQATARSLSRATVVVTVFGLVHGLGFASALGELGVREGERWPALAFFNLGVELGQLVFVAAVLGVMSILATVALAATARKLALHAAGIVGGFWLATRIAGLGSL